MIDLQRQPHSQWQVDQFTARHGEPVQFHVVITSFDGSREMLHGLATADVDLDAAARDYVRGRYLGDLPTVEVWR